MRFNHAEHAKQESKLYTYMHLRNEIGMLSLQDLSFIIQLNEFAFDKFFLDDEPFAYQCLEKWFYNKVKNKPAINFYIYCKLLKSHSNISNCF